MEQSTSIWIHWDDEREYRAEVFSLCKGLEIEGKSIKTIPCADHRQFLKAIHENRTQLDGVILDIQNGHDDPKRGLEMAKELRNELEDELLPVIILSNFLTIDNKIEAREEKVMAFWELSKSVVEEDNKELFSVLKLAIIHSKKVREIITRELQKLDNTVTKFEDLNITKLNRRIQIANEMPEMSEAEHTMLALLVRAHGEPVSNGAIRKELEEIGKYNNLTNLSRKVSELLKNNGSKYVCRSVGYGYALRERN